MTGEESAAGNPLWISKAFDEVWRRSGRSESKDFKRVSYTMLGENLVILRKVNGYSQEEIAERIHISRQAYGKWESGETIPDIMKCAQLADVYGVSVDSLLKDYSTETVKLPPAPMGKHIFGAVTMNDRGQIVIPRGAREVFALTAGSRLVVLGDEAEGLALVKAELFEDRMQFVMEKMSKE